MPILKMPKMPGKVTSTLTMKGWPGGLNVRETDIDIADDELSGGQNALIDNTGAVGSRTGRTIYGNYIGNTTKILGMFNFVNLGGTQERLVVYDTSVYRDVATVWTALTGVTMTTNKQAEGAYYESTNKFYIVNKTDQVVKYTSGAAGVQTDANFKKGQFIVAFENRLLVANVSGQEDYVWYTDLGLDTFGTNNYFRVPGGAIIGMIVAPSIKAVLIFTKSGIYRLSNFTFNGVATGPEAVIIVSQTVGCIANRSIVEVGGLVYFLGQDTKDTAQIFVTDGHNVRAIGDKIRTELTALTVAQLPNAAAIADGRFYRLSVARGTALDTEIVYDTTRKRWLPRWDNGYACYFVSETSSQQIIYGGDPSTGQVYKLTTSIAYDEKADQSYLTGQDADVAVDGNPAKRVAQSFKLSVDSGKTLTVIGVNLFLKKNTGTTAELTVRIETDSSGVPSGTLAHANLTGTISAFTDSSYVWKTLIFSTAAALSGNTTYWIVVQHTTEGSGTSQYYWGADSSSPTYANGNNATYTPSTWSAGTSDMNFSLLARGEIDFRAETKAYDFGSDFQEKWLSKAYLFSDSGDTINVGVNNLKTSTYNDLVLSVANSPTTWGGGAAWGGGKKWGGTSVKVENIFYIDPSLSNRGRHFKFRFSSSGTTANKVYRFAVKYRTSQALS